MIHIEHYNTRQNEAGEWVAEGGRVLSITACHCNPLIAREMAYAKVRQLDQPGLFFRQDIGLKGINAGLGLSKFLTPNKGEHHVPRRSLFKPQAD